MSSSNLIFSDSKIAISASAYQSNLNFLRKMIGPGVEFCSVVKGNAYGHGFESFIPLAEQYGVRWFAVYSADEAYHVKRASTRNSEIMIMGGLMPEQMEWAIEEGITFYVFNYETAETALRIAKKLRRRARVHLELETGMNRLGLEHAELLRAAELLLARAEHFELVGVCTHFAGAETVANHLRVQEQARIFEARVSELEGRGMVARYRHAASSAATFVFPETRYNMVRVGIAQYGFWPSLETQMRHLLSSEDNGKGRSYRDPYPLRRVLRWTSRVMNIKEIDAGMFVGYGTTFITTRRSRMAAVPIGYYHGFNRNLSNLGYALIRGKRAPVAGTVNMNLVLLDVTDIRDARVGDEVLLIGKQGRGEITVGAFSDLTQLLNYEALVRLSPDIEREVVS